MDDLLIILPATLLTGILAVLFELSWRKLIIPQWLARKFLHIAAVGACAIVPLYLNSLQLLSYLVFGFEERRDPVETNFRYVGERDCLTSTATKITSGSPKCSDAK